MYRYTLGIQYQFIGTLYLFLLCDNIFILVCKGPRMKRARSTQSRSFLDSLYFKIAV